MSDSSSAAQRRLINLPSWYWRAGDGAVFCRARL